MFCLLCDFADFCSLIFCGFADFVSLIIVWSPTPPATAFLECSPFPQLFLSSIGVIPVVAVILLKCSLHSHVLSCSLYSLMLTPEHLLWIQCPVPWLHLTDHWFPLICVLQIVHIHTFGPGFCSTSPASIRRFMSQRAGFWLSTTKKLVWPSIRSSTGTGRVAVICIGSLQWHLRDEHATALEAGGNHAHPFLGQRNYY